MKRPDPLVGHLVVLPTREVARVVGVEHEWDDGATLRYVTGPAAGALTMRDTCAVRRYAEERRKDGWPLCTQCGEDELYSLADPATVDTICGCYRCGPVAMRAPYVRRSSKPELSVVRTATSPGR